MLHRYVYICEDICTIDTPEETAAVRADMRDMGIESLPIFVGGPDEGEDATDDVLLPAPIDPEECEDNACTGCAWCDREVGS
jgi:hypothetical protein